MRCMVALNVINMITDKLIQTLQLKGYHIDMSQAAISYHEYTDSDYMIRILWGQGFWSRALCMMQTFPVFTKIWSIVWWMTSKNPPKTIQHSTPPYSRFICGRAYIKDIDWSPSWILPEKWRDWRDLAVFYYQSSAVILGVPCKHPSLNRCDICVSR